MKEKLTITVTFVTTLIFLTLVFSVAASAQNNVEVFKAQLSVPFGEADGKLLTVGDSLVFVDDDKTEFSFAIERSNIADINRNDSVLMIQTKQPVKDRSGEKMRFVFRIKDGNASDLVNWLNAGFKQQTMTSSSEMSKTKEVSSLIYEARHNHRLYGSCTGRIIVGDDRISYESTDDRDHSRQWLFTDIKKMKRSSPYKLEIQTFSGNGYTMEVLGKGIDISDFKALENKLAATKANR